jgi:hypothetical protein
MKIHGVKIFRSHCYVFFTVAILRFPQKYYCYVNYLITARKPKGSKKYGDVHTLRFLQVRMPSLRFLDSLIF